MDIGQLRNFLVLCDTLNYRKAAELVNIVQPALSRQIQSIELASGAQLFNRGNRTVTLTEAGKYFRKEVTRILQDLDKTVIQAAQLHNGEAGEIMVTHASSAMNTVVPGFLVAVKKKWPNLRTRIEEASNYQQIEMMLARKTDIGIAPNIVLPSDMNSKELYKENFVLILPAKHFMTRKRCGDLSLLKMETFILPQLASGMGYVEVILQLFRDHGFKPKVAHESAHAAGVMRLVEAGLGIGIEPMSAVMGTTMNVQLVELKHVPQKAVMTAFWLKDREDELQRFIEMF